MARVDGAAPQVVRSSSSPQTERVAAQAGGEHSVVQGDTLAKLAKEAYGDPSKWTLIRDANAGKVKMRGDVPIIQIGAQLTIPPAPQGWGATGAGQRKTVATADPAPVAQQTQEPQNAAQVYGNARKNLDAMEFQLKGLPAPMREQLFSKLAKGEEPGPQFKGAMEASGKFVTDLKAQAEKLPPDQQQNLQALLDREQGAWPLSNQVLEAMSGGSSPQTAAPLTSAAIARVQQDGLLEVRELGTVIGALAQDMKDAKSDATGESAVQQLSTLLQTAQIPPEQAPAFQQALGVLQQLGADDASPERIAEFARQLEALPPMRGGGVQNVPYSPLAPSLQQAVTQTVRDGQMEVREFAQVLRALSSDVQRQGDRDPQGVLEQANALMLYLTQNAKVPEDQQLQFIEAANAFGRLAGTEMASPRDINRLADQIERSLSPVGRGLG